MNSKILIIALTADEVLKRTKHTDNFLVTVGEHPNQT
jgi:hypothetical protein